MISWQGAPPQFPLGLRKASGSTRNGQRGQQPYLCVFKQGFVVTFFEKQFSTTFNWWFWLMPLSRLKNLRITTVQSTRNVLGCWDLRWEGCTSWDLLKSLKSYWNHLKSPILNQHWKKNKKNISKPFKTNVTFWHSKKKMHSQLRTPAFHSS